MSLFKVTDYDWKVYNSELRDFLPDKMVDIHVHVWKGSEEEEDKSSDGPSRVVSWPALVAEDNKTEDIDESYELFFPGKKVIPLMMASGVHSVPECRKRNSYVLKTAKKLGYPALYYSHPEQTAEEVEREVLTHGYVGLKSYLSLSPSYLDEDEIRILDFFPPHILEVANKWGLMIMCHIPRSKRFRDPVNIAQIKYITEKYPKIRLIIAHVGRAYSTLDVGDAFDELKGLDLYYDFTANTNEDVFVEMLKKVPVDRIMFGSDNPITRMRMRRIDENGKYINLIPPGLYGDPSQDSHLREVSAEEAEKITFFMYEEIISMKKALARMNMGDDAVEKIFYSNGINLINSIQKKVGEIR